MLALASFTALVLVTTLRLVTQTSSHLHRLIQRHLSVDAAFPSWLGRIFALSPTSVWSLV